MFNKENALIQGLRRLVHWGSQHLAPGLDVCPLCGGRFLGRSGNRIHKLLCPSCLEKIPWIQCIVCEVCGRYEACADCKRNRKVYFMRNRSAVIYDQCMKEWLSRYKYRGDERILAIFVEMLDHAFRFYTFPSEKAPFDCVTYVPLSEERLLERGFNQARQLAIGIGRRHSLPVLSLLTRHRHTEKQSFKSRAERLRNLRDALTIDLTGARQLEQLDLRNPKRVLVVDDVYTTGSTINQCAKVLVEHLDVQVCSLTWAR